MGKTYKDNHFLKEKSYVEYKKIKRKKIKKNKQRKQQIKLDDLMEYGLS